MINSITEIIGTLPPEQLLEKGLRKQLAVLHGSCANWDENAFSWSRFLEVLDGIVDPDEIRLYLDREKVPSHFIATNEKTDCAKIGRFLNRGASIVITHGQRFDENLAAIAHDFKDRTGYPMRVSIIASTGSSGAYVKHSDRIDLLVLQTDGTKSWNIFKHEGSSEEGETSAATQATERPIFDKDVRCGEYLFLPTGYPHICETPGERSLHLAFGFARDDYSISGKLD